MFEKLLRFVRAAVESAQNHCERQSMTPTLAHEFQVRRSRGFLLLILCQRERNHLGQIPGSPCRRSFWNRASLFTFNSNLLHDQGADIPLRESGDKRIGEFHDRSARGAL